MIESVKARALYESLQLEGKLKVWPDEIISLPLKIGYENSSQIQK